MPHSNSPLHQLAYYYGLQTSYLDMNGKSQSASNESILSILKTLGASLISIDGASEALLEKKTHDWRIPLEPVVATWLDENSSFNLRLPEEEYQGTIGAGLLLEDGSQVNFELDLETCPSISSIEISGRQYLAAKCNLPPGLPTGYHHMTLELEGRLAQTLIIRAPPKAFNPARSREKIWGAFLPLYSLHSRGSWGSGDYFDLEVMMAWLAGKGGRLLGSLPLLPSFIQDEFGPGPYMPVSKLFWNEFYLNIDRIPEVATCQEAHSLINSEGFQQELNSVNNSNYVDYSRVWNLKKQALAVLAQHFFSTENKNLDGFRKYLENNARAIDYARFRAACEEQGSDWHLWPSRMCEGNLKQGDFDSELERLFLYAQWQTQQQMLNLKACSLEQKVNLYLDLPVGVHPNGYDVWSERDSFIKGASGGAPPDPVFTSGQNWNFPPLHPQNIRESGYRYIIASLHHQMQHADLLRMDHMMGFHRLFWIPQGMENREGLYVSYHAEELYAILTLESERHKSAIIGEDLGIVPPEVRPMMQKHGIYRMFVGEYELISENRLGNIPAQAVASLNTHDMFPFAAFWQEMDIFERQKLKLVDSASSQKELEERREAKRDLLNILEYKNLKNQLSQDTHETLRALLSLLSSSQAYALLVSLEDLWLETQPQNVPGIQRHQNWSRKARHSLEEFSKLPQVLNLLSEINRIRKGQTNVRF
jgi:4-alpha-glucanotransferase